MKNHRTEELYSDKNDIVKVVTFDKHCYRRFISFYEYNDEHDVVKTRDWRKIITEYVYNDCGKVSDKTIYHEDDPNHKRYYSYAYDVDNEALMISETDPRYLYNGAKLKKEYEYDEKGRGLVTKMIDLNGQEYNNEYDDKTDEQTSLNSYDSGVTLENEFSYTKGYLTKLTHNNFNFGFSFDALGREKRVDIDGAMLFLKEYDMGKADEIETTTYVSGETSVIEYDLFGNPTKRTYNSGFGERTLFTAKYDEAGNLKEYIDNESGICYNYTYDRFGNVTKVEEKDSETNAVLRSTEYEYDSNNSHRPAKTKYNATNQKYIPIYELYKDDESYPDNEVVGVELEGKYICSTPKDDLGRIDSSALTLAGEQYASFAYSYSYLEDPDTHVATDFVESVTDLNDNVVSYTYDKCGNIETVSENGTLVVRYYYDKWNRLVREDNHKLGETYAWLYDLGGNILEKRIYELSTGELCIGGSCNDSSCTGGDTCTGDTCVGDTCTSDTCIGDTCIGDTCIGDTCVGDTCTGDSSTSELYGCFEPKVYEYAATGNRDRLVSFDGEDFQYDVLGNPTMYRGHNLEWTKVRKLASFDDNTFEYNAEGIRFKKNNTVYTLDGDRILKETNGTNTIIYYYGMEDTPIGFNYNGTDYYYVKNIQGDVTKICDDTGVELVEYIYDAWGNHKIYDGSGEEITSTSHIGYINPIRYRSYYFDVETGLYYLQTRYYDPETGRFLNSDAIEYLAPEQLGGLNLYVYCNNNPVMNVDPTGCNAWSWILGGAAVIGGAIMCATGVGAGVGAALIVGGTSMLVSETLSVAGVEGKTASLISNGLSVVAGTALCFTPLAGLGASMIGSGIGGIAGGYISEALGGSFEFGSAIGNIAGGLLGGQAYKGLVNSGTISFKVSANKVVNNPGDVFSDRFIGPKQGEVVRKINSINQTGHYDAIDVVRLPNGQYQIQDGHHTFKALQSLGRKFVRVRFTK